MRLRIRRIDRRQQVDLVFLLSQRIEWCLRNSWTVPDPVAQQSWAVEASRAMAAYKSIARRSWYAANPGRLHAMRDSVRAQAGWDGHRW